MKHFRANLAFVTVALLVIIAGLAGTSPAQTAATDSAVHPVLTFSSYLLGPSDRVNAVVAASDGSLYVAGVTLAHAGAMDARALSAGEGDAFVARLSPDGSKLIYFTYLGSSGLDEARAIALDSAGNAYVAGKTRATNFAVVRPLQPSCSLDGAGACQGTAFVAKIGPGGGVVFATYFGGSGGDEANAIVVDGSGNMFFAGSTHSLDFPVTDAVQRIAGGNGDAFVAGISADASHVLFATYVGGSDFDEARALALDASGNLYIAGQTRSLDFPVSNGLQSQCATRAQGSCPGSAFVTTLSANGQQIGYSTYLGGSGGDAANAIVVDGHGQAYVAGVTRSTDFPVSQASQRQLLGKSNAFISKLSAQGSVLMFSTYLGGSGADQANAIALDGSGNVVVGGWTYSADFPRQAPLQAACMVNKNGACTFDAFLATLAPDGSQLRFSTFLGGGGTDILRSLSVDKQGSAYLGGWTTSHDFPQAKTPQFPAGVTAPTSSRKSGAFLAKVSGLNSPTPLASCGNNWTGGAGDNKWGTAGNWSSGAVPISTDNVCIASTFTTTINVGGLAAANQTIASLSSGDTLNFNGGPLTITGNATFGADLAMAGGSLVFSGTTSMTTMHLSGGVVSGNGTITLSSLLTWGNGAICTVYSGGACPAGTNAVVNINGGMKLTSGFPSLQARTLNLPAGQTVTYAEGSSLNLGAAAVVNNTGTWDLTNDGNVFQSGNNDIFNNTATLKKTTGTGNSYIDAIFNNTGAVTVSATLLMRGGSGCSTPCTGSWTVNTGGSLQFPSGVWTLGTGMTNNSTALAGILFDGGVMDFANTGTDTFVGPVSITTGVVYGPATLNFAGLLTWGAGAICTVYSGGACPAGTNAVVNINGGMNLTSGFPSLQARTLNNPSGQTVTYTEGASLNLGAAAVVNNTGTWDLTNDGNVFQSGNNDIFNNTATLKKTTGTGNSYIDAIFNNTGAVTVSATLLMRGGSGCSTPCTGSWTVNTGGSLQFPSGVWTLGTGMTNTSTATAGILFDGGVMDFANTGTDTFVGPVSITTGVVYGPATLNFAGLLTWGAGSICTVYSGGACPAGTNAVVNINGGMKLTSGFPSLQARTLNLPAGQTVTYAEGSSLNLGAAAVVNNTGTWDLTNDGNVFQSGNNDIFNNTATLKKTTGTGNSYIDAIFNNTGVVTVSATLLMRGGSGCSTPCTGSWTVNAGGSLQFPSGVWTLGTGMTNTSTATAGILFDGGVMDFANTGTDTFVGPVSITTGVVYGPATLNFAGLLTWGAGSICTVYSGGA
ncbi:MAG TPA: SBBP repeat-containing protein, partial [Candidatus Binatus sp.]|nr:SBBP repeat-containing protein [Candidatus Binatus sp.]